MAWPPTSNNAFNVSGDTTLKWGTDGMYSTYIVKDIAPSDEVEPFYIENGTGLKVTRILLFQGRKVDITCVDNSNLTPPVIGQTITITDQLATVGGSGVTASYKVIGKDGKATRKQDADLMIHAEFLTMIEGGGNVPVGQ